MANAISPPNLLLGVYEKSGGASQFLDYENRRRRESSQGTLKSSSFTDWYMSHKGEQTFLVDTVQNSNLVSFDLNYGQTARSQSAATLEVLDPLGRFEELLLRSLFRESYSYASNLADGILESRKSWLQGLPAPGGYGPELQLKERTDVMTHTEKPLYEVNIDAFKPPIKTLQQGLTGSPGFYKPLVLVFGAGDDLRTWSAATIYHLAEISYGLTKDGVRKFTLRLVISPGALRWDMVSSKDQEGATGTKGGQFLDVQEEFIKIEPKKQGIPLQEQTIPGELQGLPSYELEERIERGDFDQSQSERVTFSNPLDIYFSLIEKAYAQLIKNKPVFLVDNISTALNSLWNKCLYNATYQMVKSQHDADRIKSGATIKVDKVTGEQTITDPEWSIRPKAVRPKVSNLTRPMLDIPDLSRRIAQNINNPNSTIDFSSFDALVGGDVAYMTDRGGQSNLFNWASVPAGGDSVDVQVQNIQKSYGKVLVPAGEFLYEDIAELAMTDDLAWLTSNSLANAWSLASDEEILSDLRYVDPALANLFATAYPDLSLGNLHNTQAYNLRRMIRIGGIRDPKKSYMKSLGEVFLLQKALGVGFSSQSRSILKVTGLKNLGKYRILLEAGQKFFKTFGMHVTKAPSLTAGAAKGTNIYENSNAKKTPQENLVDATTSLSIKFTVENAYDLEEKIKDQFNSLVGSNNGVVSISFSEITLVNKFRESYRKHLGLEYPAYESIDLLTTRGVFYSLVNRHDLTKGVPTVSYGDSSTKSPLFTGKQKKVYNAFFEAFEFYIKGENSPDIAHVAFGEQFSHPDAFSLLLDTTDGVPNFLTPAEGEDNLVNFEGIKTTKDFRTFLEQNQIPVFNYGFKNSNVINFNMDLSPWYAYMLGVIPQIVNTGMITQALGDQDATANIMDIYLNQKSSKDIKAALSKYFDNNFGSYGRGSVISDVLHGNVEGPGTDLNPIPTSQQTANASYIAAVNAVGRESLGIGGVDPKTVFVETMLTFLQLNLNHPSISNKYFINYDNQDNVIDLIARMRDKLSNRTFEGTIDTLPLYSRCSTINCLGHRALLYFVEPEINNAEGQVRSTWLSGLYTIVGFSFSLSQDNVKTSFNLLKEGNSRMGIKE